MRICILSMQRVSNFGSLLQSYALKKMLEELGHTVRFIDIEAIESDKKLLINQSTFPKSCSIMQKVFFGLKKIDKYFFNKIRVRRLYRLQTNIFQDFRVNKLNISDGDNDKHYDLCVIGSDEVFNCLTPSSWGFTSQLFGNVRQASAVITYAASCGATQLNQVPMQVRKRIEEVFSRIKAFSVRDENTREFVTKLTQKPVFLHLDPVALGDFENEMMGVGELYDKLPEHYCIIYSYYNRIANEKEIKPILNFCNRYGLEPVAVGAPQKWVKMYLPLTPFEVLISFQRADFVITDTFHGTIFSARFARKFAVTTRPSNQNKLGDLIERFHLQKHQILTFEELDKVFMIEKDQKAIDDLIIEQRCISKKYLLEYIGEAKKG